MSNSEQKSIGLPFWLTLIIIWLIVGISVGRAQSMGLYLPGVSTKLGVGREVYSFSMALTFLLMGIGAPFSGGLVDKFGAGRVVVICLLSTIAGLYAMYVATSPWILMLSGILMGIGVSGTGLTSLVGTVGRLAPPDRRLSSIASIGMAGGVGGFVALPIMHFLIEAVGWEISLIWLMVAMALLIPFAWPLDGRNLGQTGPVRDQTVREALAEAFAHPSFWYLTAGFFVCGFHVSFIVVHLPAYVADKGLPLWVGPFALSVVGIANIVGTYIAGQSGQYIEKRRGLSLIYFGRSIVFAGFLLLPPSPESIIVLSGLLGLLWLATVPLTSGLVATFFGTTWMSMLFGIVFLSHQVGSFLGVWLAGKLFDMTGSYNAMWWISIGLGLVSALLNWPIQERPVARVAKAQAAVAVAKA